MGSCSALLGYAKGFEVWATSGARKAGWMRRTFPSRRAPSLKTATTLRPMTTRGSSSHRRSLTWLSFCMSARTGPAVEANNTRATGHRATTSVICFSWGWVGPLAVPAEDRPPRPVDIAPSGFVRSP